MSTYWKLKAQRCQTFLQEKTTFTPEIILELLSKGVLEPWMLEQLNNTCQENRVVFILSQLAR